MYLVPTYEEERTFLRRKGELRCVRESGETVFPDGALPVRRRQAIPSMAGTNGRWVDFDFTLVFRESIANKKQAMLLVSIGAEELRQYNIVMPVTSPVADNPVMRDFFLCQVRT